MGIRDRLAHAWNAFTQRDPTDYSYGATSYRRPDRVQMSFGNDQSMVNAIYNRIAVDGSGIDLRHVRLDQNGRYLEDIVSSLQDRLSLDANIDQTGRQLLHDCILSLCDEGAVAVVPVETSINPTITEAYKIHSLRVGKIVEWFPKDVKVELYNDKTGLKEDVIVPKKATAILENPFYAVMNESNSTLKRLIHKLNLLDAIDNASSSGKLDLIIQLPYTIKSELKREQANKRMKDIEDQLAGSKYGVAYTDGVEKITQLNRPAENNLMAQIEYLTSMLFGQLGITTSVIDGTANEETMLNYYTRTVEPIVTHIVDEFNRKFLSKTARAQKQRIMYFKDPFKLVPVSQLAEIADKFTRNEIASANEIRSIVGWMPHPDPKANKLINSNLNQQQGQQEEIKMEPKSNEEQG